MMRRFFLPAMLGAALAGCASYHPAPIDPAQNAAQLSARSLRDPRLLAFVHAMQSGATAARSAPAAPARWDLSTLTLAALYYHPNLDLARSSLAQARGAIRTARQRPNPTLVFQDLSYNQTVRTPSPWTIGPSIEFVIETGGKRAARTAQARHLAAAAREDLATASWQVRSGVRNALIDLWAARQSLAQSRRNLAVEEQLVVATAQRFAAGGAAGFDLAQARIHRDEARLTALNAQNREAQARNALAGAIGIPVAALHGITISFADIEAPQQPAADIATGALRKAALTGRSDVQSALADYAAAESALQLAIADQYPDIALAPGYDYNQGDNQYLLMPTVPLPIFHQNQGQIAQALAQREQAAAQFTALQDTVLHAIDQAVTEYRASARSLASAQAIDDEEVREYRRMQSAFDTGDADRPSLIAAQLTLATATQAKIDALARQRRALGSLEDALQHPFFAAAAPLPLLTTDPRLSSLSSLSSE